MPARVSGAFPGLLKGSKSALLQSAGELKLAAIAIADFPARPGADRNAFLAFTALVWVGVLSGFGFDSYTHVSKHGLDFPLIVHPHALAFVGYVVLFTTQLALIRNGREDIHRRLGIAGAALAAGMCAPGPPTAAGRRPPHFSSNSHRPDFSVSQHPNSAASPWCT